MAGLRMICKMYGGMKVSDGKTTINYVWDYAADEPVPDTEMPLGSERWKASREGQARGSLTMTKWPPPNLVHIALFELDSTLLTSADGKRIEVSLEAVCRLIASPPPMLLVDGEETREPGGR